MCQLIVANMRDPKLNKLYIEVQSYLDSAKLNQDGWGILSTGNGKLWKDERCACRLVNVNDVISGLIGNSKEPVFAHVRQATHTKGVKTVCYNNTHPFETEHLFVAHNGSLTPRNPEEWKDDKYKDLIDSNIFALFLEDEFVKDFDIVKALQRAYEHFYGKFAFFIYIKKTKESYVARGVTADLHAFFFLDRETKKTAGYVINTQWGDLDYGKDLYLNVAEMATGKKLDSLTNQIYLLDKNSIFKLEEDEIKKVGDLIEVKEPVKDTVTPKTWEGYGTRQHTNTKPEISADSKAIYKWMEDYDISLVSLDNIFQGLFGNGMFMAVQTQVEWFVKTFIPEMEKNFNKKTLELWRQILKNYHFSDTYFYQDYRETVKFPYFINPPELLEKILTDLQKEAK